MSLDFYCNIEMVGPKFGVNSMKTWIHSALYQKFRLLLARFTPNFVICYNFSTVHGHAVSEPVYAFIPLSPNGAHIPTL